MSSHVIRNEAERNMLIELVRNRKLPITVSIAKGAKRSIEQNRLNRLWMQEIAEQLGEETPEGYRGFCKLHFAVPILRAENEDFRQQYDHHVKGLPYESKLAIMQEPIDLPVTRLMTTAQKKQYLDEVWSHFTGRGVQLTDPDAIQWRAA